VSDSPTTDDAPRGASAPHSESDEALAIGEEPLASEREPSASDGAPAAHGADTTADGHAADSAGGVEVAQAAILGRLFDEPITELPEDLYIPPEALRIFLEAFEGPLDLLLYLIRRQNLDILSIDVAAITRQYIEYVELMEAMEIELAGEYLLMAAMLAEIKSRTLLPRPPKGDDDGEEEDPRAELIRRLQEYERLKQAAEALAALPRIGRDWFPARAGLPPLESRVIHPDVELDELLGALAGVLRRVELNQAHQISREGLSTRERMLLIMEKLHHERYTPFEALFTLEEGRSGVVVTFMAILELAKEAMIEIVQNAPLSPIHVRARLADDSEEDAFEGEGFGDKALADAFEEVGESPFADLDRDDQVGAAEARRGDATAGQDQGRGDGAQGEAFHGHGRHEPGPQGDGGDGHDAEDHGFHDDGFQQDGTASEAAFEDDVDDRARARRKHDGDEPA